jgi:hypothetical protein
VIIAAAKTVGSKLGDVFTSIANGFQRPKRVITVGQLRFVASVTRNSSYWGPHQIFSTGDKG